MAHRDRFRAVLISLLAGAALLTSSATTSAATEATPGSREAVSAKVLHRVVWLQDLPSREGLHLRSAEPDGSDVRTVYDAPKGFTLQLTLDREGRRVAFSPCCRRSSPLLVVAPVLGGKALDPLARHRHRFYFVGGIGWSPDGRRLAFEALTTHGTTTASAIWTVRPNGLDLRRVLRLPDYVEGEQPLTNDALAWTRDGILYSDGTNLRSAWAGHSRLVMRHVRSVRVSGDQRSIVVGRYLAGRGSIWIAAPDGTGARRLLVYGDPYESTAYSDITPNYDGTEVLAWRRRPLDETGHSDHALVTWSTSGRPNDATELGFSEDNDYVATWN